MGNNMGGKCSTMTCTECAGKHKKCKARVMGQWARLQTSGRSPSPRSGHDVTVIGNKVEFSAERYIPQIRMSTGLGDDTQSNATFDCHVRLPNRSNVKISHPPSFVTSQKKLYINIYIYVYIYVYIYMPHVRQNTRL